MKPKLLYVINHLTSIFPPTILFRLKSGLYRLSGVKIASSARITSSCNIWGVGDVIIGKDTFIGHDTIIITADTSIKIGNNVDISSRVNIINGTHKVDVNGWHTAGEGYGKTIIIEDGVWIGAGATIIGGAKIGKKSVIAAGSVVVDEIPSGVIAGGVPCKVIKSINDK